MSNGPEIPTLAAIIILGIIAIWWLLRSGEKHTSADNYARTDDQDSIDLQDFHNYMTASQQKEAPQQDQKVIDLEKKLAEMDEKIAKMNQTTTNRPPAWPQSGWNMAAPPYPGTVQTLPMSPEMVRMEVYRMAEAGQEATDIAQSLSISRGEVELLLNMRNE